jgi:tyrosyl-tRNA synthetase
VFTCDLLVGLDGSKKMSKSLDNYVGFTDTPVDKYGKIMSLPDELIAGYYRLCTDIELTVIDDLVRTLAGGANPRDAKASLAREIVRQFHGDEKALKAEADWNATFRDKSGPTADQIEEIKVKGTPTLIDFLVSSEIISSRTEVRRLIASNGIKVDGDTADDENLKLKSGHLLQIGKRRFFKLK